VARPDNPREAVRVKICTTPPIASDPYRAEKGPRTISILSMFSVVMAEKS